MKAKNIDIIKKYEGLELDAYLCPAGVLTIGYGHTKNVKKGQSITEIEAEELLKKDLKYFENLLNKLMLDLNQNQFDALISWIFNLGFGNFLNSTLKRIIERGYYMDDMVKVLDLSNGDPCKEFLLEDGREELTNLEYQFVRWCSAGGKALRGLYNRRKDEYKLYTKAV